MDLAYAVPSDPGYGSRPHPCLHDPVLFVTNLPAFVSDETLASALVGYGPFRPKIIRDGMQATVAGAIEFRYLEKGLFPSVFVCVYIHPLPFSGKSTRCPPGTFHPQHQPSCLPCSLPFSAHESLSPSSSPGSTPKNCQASSSRLLGFPAL